MLTIEEKDGKKILMLDGYPVEVGDRVWDSYYGKWRDVKNTHIMMSDLTSSIKDANHVDPVLDQHDHVFWQPPERPPKPKKAEAHSKLNAWEAVVAILESDMFYGNDDYDAICQVITIAKNQQRIHLDVYDEHMAKVLGKDAD